MSTTSLKPGTFKPGNTFAKGNQGCARRISYDKLWKQALEKEERPGVTSGQLFVDKLTEHRDCADRNISLKACDVFFKYARPPENIIMNDSSKDAALQVVDNYGLSALQYRKVKEAGLEAQHDKIQEILKEKENTSNSDMGN